MATKATVEAPAAAAWDETWDFVIAGSGAGAVIAALLVKSAGGRPLMLESTDKYGGSTALSGGVAWIPTHPLIERSGASDSFELARAYLDGCAGPPGPGSTPERRDTFVRSGPEMVDFLEGMGMKFMYPRGWPDYHEGELQGGKADGRCLMAEMFDLNRLGKFADELRPVPGRPPVRGNEPALGLLYGRTWASKMAMLRIGWRMMQNRLLGRRIVGTGPSLQGRLFEILLRNKVDMRKNAEVRELVVEDGRVAGVIAHIDGRDVRIRGTKGVLIAAGGFSRNDAMRKELQPQLGTAEWTVASPGDMGVMLKAAVAAGADTHLLDQSWWLPVSTSPDGEIFLHTADNSKPHCIIVDSKGQRFVNESTSYITVGNTIFEHNKTTPCVPCWSIIDSDHRDRYMWGSAPPRKTPKSWIDKGYMKKANTLDELARLCGIDAEGLKKTVERFNGFAAKGEDLDFGRGKSAFAHYYGDPTNKPNPNLGAIAKAPFYAVATYPGDVGTCGGVVCDEHSRVLDKDGAIIPGLYASGNSTATVMGRSYPGAGSSIGPSAVFGYVAARHAIGGAA